MEQPELREWWEPYETVLRLWDQGRLEESAALVEQGRREYPDAPALALAAARQIVREDDGQRLPANATRAMELVRQAVAADPSQPEILLLAALTSYDFGEREAARAYAEALAPSHEALNDVLRAFRLHILALLARDRGEIGEALDALRRAAALDPDEPEHAALLAELLAESGRVRFPAPGDDKLSFTVRGRHR